MMRSGTSTPRPGRRLATALLTLLLACAPLAGCAQYFGNDLDIPGFDPGTTTSNQANTQAALDYLSPDGQVSPDGQWAPGQQTQERWKSLEEGNWNSSGLEELTAAMAAVSTMRTGQDDETTAAATWIVAKSMEFTVGQVPLKNYTNTMKHNLATLLANNPEELAGLANGGSLEVNQRYGLSGLVTDSQFETLLYRVIDNQNAADTLTSTLLQYHHNQVDSTMPTATDPEATLLGLYKNAAMTMGYLDGIAELRADDNTPDTIDVADIKTVLRAQAYVDAAQYGLLSDTAMEAAATGNNGQPFSFYTETDGQPTITAPDPMTPQAAQEYMTWDRLSGDPTMRRINSEMVNSTTGYEQGQGAKIIK
ncbi:DUF6571 family protein [Actinomyces sp. MRS3W]|uniref:DUF6571 family protein n=1 Tax=Actinomyces sp. MRS3W TaxID=2800796 RepID=UPI0028FD64FD|nr:DUF6571 family protein [Actinomyces sp. MRS3W]MDU0347867.1 DUF6571 family protein [Actinomyces sp. MRS3W]